MDTDTVKYTEKTIVPHYKTKPDGSYEYDKDGKKKIEYYTATYVKITLTEPQTLQEIKTSVGDPIEVTTSKKIYVFFNQILSYDERGCCTRWCGSLLFFKDSYYTPQKKLVTRGVYKL